MFTDCYKYNNQNFGGKQSFSLPISIKFYLKKH